MALVAAGRSRQGCGMAKAFTTDELLIAFDEIGAAAAGRDQVLELAVYGGSALMLASNFRFASEDVDIAPLDPWPDWLRDLVRAIGERNGWSDEWFNDAVGVHLSPQAGPADHVLLGSFPRRGAAGMRVSIPTAEYMLALKLKALRLLDPSKGAEERRDIAALMKVCAITRPEDAVALLARYFPVSAAAPEKLLFPLKHINPDGEAAGGSPRYPQ
jgi:hypothetical protein